MRVESVQYSPSGIFSDKICACNPLNRTAKVIRHSTAITTSVSCMALQKERISNVSANVRPVSKSRQHKLSRCCRLFGFFLYALLAVRDRLCFCFRLHFFFYYCVFLCWLLLLLRSPPFPTAASGKWFVLAFYYFRWKSCQADFVWHGSAHPYKRFTHFWLCIRVIRILLLFLCFRSCKFFQFLICNPIFSSRFIRWIAFSVSTLVGHTSVWQVYIRHNLRL